jgi:hypothetical protein
MDQNAPAVTLSGATTTAGSLDAAEAIGQTVLSCTTGGDETINHWITVAGDMCPHMLIATSTGDTNTVWPALRDSCLNTAVVTHYTQTTVTEAYAAGHDGAIAVTANVFQVGQMVTFGVAATTAALAAALARYTVVEIATGFIYLDRPLEVLIADNSVVNPGPAGNYNFAFHKNAIALVTRPLALPPQGIGAMSSVVSYNGLSIRATLTYDGNAQGILVTLDLLFGVACLDSTLGVAMLG